MTESRVVHRLALLLMSTGLYACAGAGGNSMLKTPAVELTSVEMSRMSFTNQTFLLGFNVSNPNPFPVPVRSVRYRVRLNNQNFAGGETASDFTIPPGGEEDFVISVDLDLLQAGAQLTSIIRSGVRDNIDYEIYGALSTGIPTSPTLRFSNSGTIMVQSELF